MTDSDSDSEQQRRREPEIDNSCADLPPLFWDSIPENASENLAFQAIEALREECTPEERAESFKVRRFADGSGGGRHQWRWPRCGPSHQLPELPAYCMRKAGMLGGALGLGT